MIGYSKAILFSKNKTKRTPSFQIGLKVTDYLTIAGPVFWTKGGSKNERLSRVVCHCSCGNHFVAKVSALKNGDTYSCGCFNKQGNHNAALIHGGVFRKNGKKSKTALYCIWSGMKSRCFHSNNKKFDIYGGKGITVCDEWLDYTKFKEWALSNGYFENITNDPFLNPSLDRIDSNGHYCPKNCRWVTRRENSRNVTAERDNKIRNLELSILWSQINDFS